MYVNQINISLNYGHFMATYTPFIGVAPTFIMYLTFNKIKVCANDVNKRTMYVSFLCPIQMFSSVTHY